ncbi:UTRA domain-containing protein [Actinomadura rifamycini]|uniref:UTRA domain-containing protein n=1 Tax=Actinomadura rifamycini TaxID=31962 RepID=UPI0004010A67|nr:UTRA domain-containing protein [Actinomadura rifamycini]
MWAVSSLPYLAPRRDGEGDAWSQEAAQAGRTGTQNLRKVVMTAPPADAAAALALPEDASAVLRGRTILLDDRPVELVDSWYPADVAAGTALAEHAKIKGGAVTLLADLGYTVHEAREEIEVRPATAEEADGLGLPDEAPVIVLRRTCLTAEGVPFEYSVMVMVPEGRRLRYRMIAS